MRQALSRAPEDVAVLSTAGSIHLMDGHYRAAVEMYKRARAVDPHDAEIHALLAQAYLGARKRAECEAALTEALRLTPRNEIALGVRAEFEAIYFDVAKAEQTAKKRLKKSPESAGAHVQLGEICLAKGEVNQGYWHFREALRLSPNSEEAKAALVSALIQRFRLYNWLHRLSFRFRRYRFLGSFGTYYVLFQIVRITYTQSALPAWLRYSVLGLVAPIAILVTVALLPLPFVNLAVRFHPIGRYAFARIDRAEAAFAAVVVVCGLAALPVGLIRHSDDAMAFMAMCCFAVV